MRRAKIVATLGPALDDPARLKAALTAGVDVVRLNFSHGTHAQHAERLDQVRHLAAELDRTVGSLGDLQGPKIRLGLLPEEGVMLEDGGEVILIAPRDELEQYNDGAGVPMLPVVYEGFAKDVEAGALVLIHDGLLRLVVSRVEGEHVVARVIAGGLATSRKGVNLPGVDVSAGSMTDKDREDVAAMVEMGVDWIALSFVRRPADIIELRQRIADLGGQQPIIAKLERPEAIECLDEIMAVTDAVMVARGDLGVEIGPERVPALQKRIINLANREGKPVITATEMLESMTHSARPTRAEASDVANAIFDGTDAVMLSGETAAGRFPVEAVRTMARIAEEAEDSDRVFHTRLTDPRPGSSLARVVAKAAVQVAADINAKAIVVFSLSGGSVQLVSKFRPDVPVIGLTTTDAARRRLSLMWGTRGAVVPEKDNSAALIEAAEDVCLRKGVAGRGDTVVIVSGIPGGHGGTNRLLVHRLGDLSD